MTEPTLNDIYSRLGNLEGTMRGVDKKIDTFIAHDTEAYEALEKRVRSLESERSKLYGIVAGVSAVVGFAVSFVKDWLHSK